MTSETIGAIVGGVIAGLIVLFFAVLIIRTVLNRPKVAPGKAQDLAPVDKAAAVQHLREAIRIPTVSMTEDYVDNIQPFIDYRDWLEKTYPLLNAAAEREIIAGYSIIYHLKGTDPSLKGGCYLSHIDVVPAPKDGWEYDPFEGVLTDDGYIYGRGAQDMKSHMIALLEAVEYHLAHGKKFARDLYLCFGHDEEPGNSTVGASHTVALIGACEKGNGDLELVVKKAGGHASNPKPPTAVGLLSKAVAKVESHPMKTYWTPMTKETFKSLSPYCKGAFKFILTNRDVFSPLLKFVFTKVAPMTNALVRSTFAPTMLWGSDARNVIPKEARANINFRIITGETGQEVKQYLNKLLGDKVEVNLLTYSDPSPEADVHCTAYNRLRDTIVNTFDDIVVAPYMFIAASDARFYNPLTDNVFRFGPFINSLDDQSRIHGINERLHVDQLEKATQFFVKCLDTMLAK